MSDRRSAAAQPARAVRRESNLEPAARRESSRTARGYRIRDFCQREGITRQTCWNWARKGVVVVSRLGPAVGVRVAYLDE